MAFVSTNQGYSFDADAVTNFSVRSALDSLFSKRYVTYVTVFAGNAQLAQHTWKGDSRLNQETVGKAIVKARYSSDSVLSFESLITEELK
jgi:hypothetical protein